MNIESVMYFALGALASGLVMLMIMPAVWRRAVRLTRKRIEAATPITLAEFRADKDQLRAEYALSTRRLEMNVEQLRRRLAAQLGGDSRVADEVQALRRERDEQAAIARELEARETELRDRILELEREGTQLTERLRAHSFDGHEFDPAQDSRPGRIETSRQKPRAATADGGELTGNYDEDVEDLLAALTAERKRAGFFEEQARGLRGEVEKLDGTPGQALATAAREPSESEDPSVTASQNLAEAEVRMANAESRLNALLEETGELPPNSRKHEQLLAEKLTLEAQVEQLREKVLRVESTVMADWDTDRLVQSHLRDRLNDIASDVSRLVYAVDNHASPDPEESLFDRVQRFAEDGVSVESFPVRVAPVARPSVNGAPRPIGRPTGATVADRMLALRELQGRN